MRIIGGRFRGTRLGAPGAAAAHGHLRPTSDRVREAIFNLLAHGDYGSPPPPEGRRVLDLFAGTGALGLEALSRGAAFAVFVEDHPASRALIRENVERLRLTGQTKIWRRDATRLGPCRGAPFELIFADPPYKTGLAAAAVASARQGGWMAAGAILLLETALDEPPPDLAPDFGTDLATDLPGLVQVDLRHYGETRISIYRDAGAGPLGTPGPCG